MDFSNPVISTNYICPKNVRSPTFWGYFFIQQKILFIAVFITAFFVFIISRFLGLNFGLSKGFNTATTGVHSKKYAENAQRHLR